MDADGNDSIRSLQPPATLASGSIQAGGRCFAGDRFRLQPEELGQFAKGRIIHFDCDIWITRWYPRCRTLSASTVDFQTSRPACLSWIVCNLVLCGHRQSTATCREGIDSGVCHGAVQNVLSGKTTKSIVCRSLGF